MNHPLEHDAQEKLGWTRACEGILRAEFGRRKSNAADRAMRALSAKEGSRQRRQKRIAVSLAMAACFVALASGLGIYFSRRSNVPVLALPQDIRVLVRRAGNDVNAGDGFRLEALDIVTANTNLCATIRYSGEATCLYLASGTELELLPWARGKRFKLRRGRVAASVARQPARHPMIWTTGQAEVRVIGTQFHLESDGLATRLEVVKGKVQFGKSSGSNSVEVGQNQFALVAPGQELTVQRWIPPSGVILRELWTDVPGNTVEDLRAQSRFPESPDDLAACERFETGPSLSQGYGARFRGWLHPPVSGDYSFWIASDDASELWLSASDDPKGKQKIALVRLWTDEHAWDSDPSQRSRAIRLQAGQKYYIEALHKQGIAGDHLSVAWKIPGESRSVIEGRYLSPFLRGME